MRKILTLLVLTAISSLLVQGELPTYRVPGSSIYPIYDHEGNFVFCYEKSGLGIFLGDSSIPDQSDPRFHTQVISGDVHSLRLKKDPAGRLWMTWEQWEEGIVSVYLARLEDRAIVEERDVDHGVYERNQSPDFDFDPWGNIWMTWINKAEGYHQVLVEDTANTRTWCVNPSPTLPVYTPRITVTPNSGVWVFWITQGMGHYQICSRRFDGQNWSEVSFLNQNEKYPHLFPEIALDELGHPWAVWSGYDGRDYEIWYTRWDGKAWFPQRQITSNRNISDMYPMIIFLPGNIPFISWSQQGSTSRILAVFLKNGVWSPEICLVQDEGFNRRPHLALGIETVSLGWENVHDHNQLVNAMEFTLSSITNRDTKVYHPEDRYPRDSNLRNKTNFTSAPLVLKENYFIAFGDSITYGVLARMWFPDKGYVPRLEILLKTFIDGARVLNRGLPGEQTWEGLARLEEVLEESGAKYILIMEGTNDMTGRIPSETAAFNLEEMVKKCLDAGVYPLTATIIPRSDSLWRQRIEEPTLVLNQLIRQMALSYALPLADQYDRFMSYPEGYLSLFSDGAHPNEMGYQLMAETWFDHIHHLPYPPLHFTAERKLNQILFYDEHLNLLRWEENPLWVTDQQVSSLRIYRKSQSGTMLYFDLITVQTSEISQYIDRDIEYDKTYLYYIQAEHPSGVRGPASRIVSDR